MRETGALSNKPMSLLESSHAISRFDWYAIKMLFSSRKGEERSREIDTLRCRIIQKKTDKPYLAQLLKKSDGKTMNEQEKDIKLFKEVNWLYDRLTKKEMNVLTGWVSANCNTVKDNTIDELEKWLDDYHYILSAFRISFKKKIREMREDKNK